MVAKDADEGDNARITYSLSHGNDQGLFHVEELTGAVTTTRLLPVTPAEYRLVITAQDHGDPARVTVVDLRVIVNDTAATHLRQTGLADRLVDERFFVVFGVVCGVAVVSGLALIVCVILVLRRSTAKPSRLKRSGDARGTALDRDDRPTDNCVASAVQRDRDCNDEYTRMIDVRPSSVNFTILLSSFYSLPRIR